MGAAPGAPGDADGGASQPRQVLVVDDDSLTRDVLSTLLQLQEYELAQAADGDEALARAEAHDVDLVVLDATMPGMDGYEVCARLKAECGDIRVVLLAAADVPADRERSRAAGADAFLTKPFSPLELIDTMHQLTEGS